MILAKETNIATGEQSEAFLICGVCYEDRDVNLAFNCPEIFICVVEDKVSGTCSECSEFCEVSNDG